MNLMLKTNSSTSLESFDLSRRSVRAIHYSPLSQQAEEMNTEQVMYHFSIKHHVYIIIYTVSRDE